MADAEKSNLWSRRNVDGNTPLKVLEASMERRRTIHQFLFKRTDISDQFTGFDDATLSCLTLLRGLASGQLSEAALSRLRLGCTCGRCLGGFLSPRMRDILISTTETTFDFLYTDGDDMDGESWYEENEDSLEYLPEPIKQNLTSHKSMRTRFCKLWNHFSSCLKENLVPTEENILPMVRNANE